MKKIETEKVLPTPAPAIQDAGNVRVGFIAPAFPPVRAVPAKVDDSGKARIGFIAPAFPPLRSR